MLAWVIGSGGMLGSALVDRADERTTVHVAERIPWDDAVGARAALVAASATFAADAQDGPWAILWAAGSSVVATGETGTADELAALEALLTVVAAAPPRGPGAVFVSSSAGGLFAGASPAPFDDTATPAPISPYGRLKLDQELAAARILAGRVPLVVGRFSNLYGPRANPAKAQGLVPQLCLATVRRQPINLYVSMDTVRDYLYADDAADMAWHLVRAAVRDQPAVPRTAIIASGQPTTVAHVIATVQNVAHRRVPLALGTHPTARHQVTDLRMVASLGLPPAPTPLATGVKRVFDSYVTRVN